MIITVAVMAHPKRKKQAMALHRQLIKYPFANVRVVWDEINDEWDTGERSLRCGANMGDWHLVIQDDAILTPRFYENIEGALSMVPSKSLVSLYTGTARPYAERVSAAVEKAYHATWLSHMLLLWGVAVLIPSDHIKPMLEFAFTRKEQYDTRIGIFYQRNMLPVYYTMPSLVDHDDDLGSLLAHGTPDTRRVAHKLAKGYVTWNKSVIDI